MNKIMVTFLSVKLQSPTRAPQVFSGFRGIRKSIFGKTGVDMAMPLSKPCCKCCSPMYYNIANIQYLKDSRKFKHSRLII